MRSLGNPWRRGPAAALATIQLALALGAGFHSGSHLDPEIAWLPADFHHHTYGFAAGPPEAPRRLDPCLACHLSRLGLRLPTPPAAPVALATVVDPAPPATAGEPRPVDLASLAPRAPPLS